MTARAFLDGLLARDVLVTAIEDRLHVDAPLGVLTVCDREKLRVKKAEILAILAPPDNAIVADVLALAEARGFPKVAVGGAYLSGMEAWRAAVPRFPTGRLCAIRAALLDAQRIDGPYPTDELDLE